MTRKSSDSWPFWPEFTAKRTTKLNHSNWLHSSVVGLLNDPSAPRISLDRRSERWCLVDGRIERGRCCPCRWWRDRWLGTDGETPKWSIWLLAYADCSTGRTKLRCLSFALLVALFHLNGKLRRLEPFIRISMKNRQEIQNMNFKRIVSSWNSLNSVKRFAIKSFWFFTSFQWAA